MKQLLTSKAFVYDAKYMAKKSIKQLNLEMRNFILANDDLFRIWIVFNKPTGDKNFGMKVKSDYKNLYTEVGVDAGNTIYVNREKSGNVDFHDKFKKLVSEHTDFDIRNARQVDMEIILDRSSVESFFFEGMYAMTNLIFPDELQRGLEIFPDDDERITIE